jgi:hypothetical protein
MSVPCGYSELMCVVFPVQNRYFLQASKRACLQPSVDEQILPFKTSLGSNIGRLRRAKWTQTTHVSVITVV